MLRADQSACTAVQAAHGRSPHLVNWAVTIVHPESAVLSADRGRREAVLAVEWSMRRRGTPAPEARTHLGWVRRSWRSLALGTALVVISGAHWVPALAGTWLLAGRSWISALLGLSSSCPPTIARTAVSVEVSAAAHAGLSQIASVLDSNADGEAGYGPALALARMLGLSDAAALYETLAAQRDPATLLPEIGVWLPDTRAHESALVANAMIREKPAGTTGDESPNDTMDEFPST